MPTTVGVGTSVYSVPDPPAVGTLRFGSTPPTTTSARPSPRLTPPSYSTPSAPYYLPQLYARLADAESINPALDYSHWSPALTSRCRDRPLLTWLGSALRDRSELDRGCNANRRTARTTLPNSPPTHRAGAQTTAGLHNAPECPRTPTVARDRIGPSSMHPSH